MKMKILVGVLSVVVVGAAQAAWVSPFEVPAPATAYPGAPATVGNWVLSASAGGTASIANPTPSGSTNQTVALTALAPNTVAKFLISVPNVGGHGQTVSFNATVDLDHPLDEFGYWYNGGFTQLGMGSGLNLYSVGPMVLNIGDTFGYQITTGGVNDQAVDIRMTIQDVPEPTTIVLNGLVMLGVAGGYVWNRRRKLA